MREIRIDEATLEYDIEIGNVSLPCELESRMPKLAFGSSSSELTLSYRGKRDACEINQSNCLLSDFTDGVVY